VGDVMYDAVLQYLGLAEQKSRILERLGLVPKSYALATVHRAENTDNPNRLRAIFDGLEAVAQAGLPVVLPLHPRTRKQAESLGLSLKGVRVLEPVSYLDMLLLEKNARLIITDSGGVQKEAFFFRVPCVTLREETEWVETVETGWNVLVGCDPKRIRSAALLAQPGAESACPYGDGRAGEKILEALKELHREVRE
ncbi:MAG: UDP-N-acetylglucosamine 2-epimerase, partial [Anaerolineae bacterium]|nr:UDP-N-acetylglucosamine 2-epimerase [Anaerolineae bacterium]